ncbi:MAG TPA: DinB family protein [Fimbriimonadaceae bacterium]|nr:DinB family protein [Fimbriimonadaceae bacterium]HRJ32338.1 DinB family protein [Fimbriimonadaceae bacterium]
MSNELKQHLRKRIEDWGQSFAKDLKAIPEEHLGASPSGIARAPIDFTYEVAVVNRRIANRIGGGENPPWPFEGWVTAPEEFRDRDKALAELDESVQAVVAALDAFPAEKLSEEVETPNGPYTVAGLADMVGTHMAYHDGQLNYLQSLYGDNNIHWQD